MKRKGLSRFESLAQELVEGGMARILGGRLESLDIATQLARVMEDRAGDNDRLSTYIIALNPRDYQELLAANPKLDEVIAQTAWQVWKAGTGRSADQPAVKVGEDTSVRRHKIVIRIEDLAAHDKEGGNTVIRSGLQKEAASVTHMLNLDAFLIIQGRRHVSLSQPIITIGRRTDNDIVLDLPTVSRKHAQIRWRFGHFVLYDVSSRGRTMVNGHQVREHVLKSGDVIALSDALLIYGEGLEAASLPRAESSSDDSRTLIRSPRV